MILDLAYALKKLLENCSDTDRFTIYDIGVLTHIPVPYIWEICCKITQKDLNVRDIIKQSDLHHIVEQLIDQAQPIIEKKQKKILENQKKSIEKYFLIDKKIKLFQKKNKWHHAYRSLVYFLSMHEKFISKELILSIWSECLWMGFKAKINLQELYHNFHKAIAIIMIEQTPKAALEVLDFIDAYFDSFVLAQPQISRYHFYLVINQIKNFKDDSSVSPIYKEIYQKILAIEDLPYQERALKLSA